MMLQRLEIFIKRKFRKIFSSFYQKNDRDRLRNTDFVLISRNCWGGQAYQWLGKPYNTPFVGLFLYGPCYMKLLRNFDEYIHKQLRFIEISKYPDAYNNHPIGLLGDVEIHFQHYDNENEAREKWERRKQRMLKVSKDNYFYTICDRRNVTSNDIEEFHEMEFKNKLSFSFERIDGLCNRRHIKFIKDPLKKKGSAPNGKKRFKLSFLYFDMIRWLNDKTVIRTRFKA
ncbi:DUF1919 domain-containing protein [Maribacter confluentis]|uniref:DUF1919 domain-containing protein n=1 Tax=Maribacter confluentis TaxID=1656093 RepID=A0ABT8RVD9_9FLAO|nr:DUF1919 domain-containing protein [Maribacter confluentis]MDO1514051.1 DUF1919 domain-containing protein [Maribacter confluentis]